MFAVMYHTPYNKSIRSSKTLSIPLPFCRSPYLFTPAKHMTLVYITKLAYYRVACNKHSHGSLRSQQLLSTATTTIAIAIKKSCNKPKLTFNINIKCNIWRIAPLNTHILSEIPSNSPKRIPQSIQKKKQYRMHLLFLELFFWIACTLLLMSAVAISDDVAAMRMGWMDERTDWMNGCVCVCVCFGYPRKCVC